MYFPILVLFYIVFFCLKIEASINQNILSTFDLGTTGIDDFIDFDRLEYLRREFKKPHVTKWKCLGPLGCFSNGPPFYHPKLRPISLFPYNRKRLAVNFQLYTQYNPRQHDDIRWEYPETILDSKFNPNRTTKILVHGLMSRPEYTEWLQGMTEELLSVGDYNIIVVIWSNANKLPYEQAVANSRAVGVELSLMIKSLVINAYLQVEDIHVIGHGLGAHVAGYAGQLIQGLGRISGLSPSGPYFAETDQEVKLDRNDANFVDVIHTDSSEIFQLGLGSVEPSGDVDVYVNGGVVQPGCPQVINPIVATFLGFLEVYQKTITCNYQRSVDYFRESTYNNQCKFVGIPCRNYESFLQGRCGDCGDDGKLCYEIGLNSHDKLPAKSWHGRFYLKTNKKPPYCAFQYHLTFQINSKSPIVTGKIYIGLGNDKIWSYTNITQKSERFKPGNVYQYYISTQINVVNVSNVIFWWNPDSPTSWNLQKYILVDKLTLSPIQLTKRNLKTYCFASRIIPKFSAIFKSIADIKYCN